MKNSNRIAVLIGLVLLFVVLAAMPSLDVSALTRPLRHISPWLLLVLFWIFCCRGGGCCRRRCGRRDDNDAVQEEEST